MNKLSFSRELVDALVRYLATKPYAEVADLLARVNNEAAPQLQPAPAPEASDAQPEKKEEAPANA